MTLFNGQLRSRTGYIPTEILSEIFLRCLDVDALGCTTPNPLLAPLVLSWVCRVWRYVTINTHHLWTGITFARKPERIFDSTRLLELWIARSGALPFGVRLSKDFGHGGSSFSIESKIELETLVASGFHTFMDTLLTCSMRWRVLEVIVPDISFSTPLLQALVKDSPRLEHFGVLSQYLGLYETSTQYDFSLNTALQTVRLVTPLIRPLSPSTGLTFPSLTFLELHFCTSIQSCLVWLDMTPNLKQLILRLYGTEGHLDPRHGRHVLRLPSLASLEITSFATSSRFDDPGLLLDVLELPALIELELDLNYLSYETPWPHLGNLLVRSGASLEGLVLSGTPMSEEDVVECLRLSPSLQYLDCATVTDNILLALTPSLRTDNTTAISSNIAPVCEQSGTESLASVYSMEVDSTEGDGCIADTRTSSEDLGRYTVMCPSLKFLESDDIDVCSLQTLYAMMCARCGDVYKFVEDYVDLSTIRSTPPAFKTLDSVILPCDPLYEVLSHPSILNNFEKTVYF